MGHRPRLALPVPRSSRLPRRPQRIDFTWPVPRVAVETDGRERRATQATWGEDHERDLAPRLAGWTPRRCPHGRLAVQPHLDADDLRNALRPPGGGRSGRRAA